MDRKNSLHPLAYLEHMYIPYSEISNDFNFEEHRGTARNGEERRGTARYSEVRRETVRNGEVRRGTARDGEEQGKG